MKRFTYLCFVCVLPVCAVAAAAAPMYHLTTLASFNDTNGRQPLAGLIADASGNLYGTTAQGGANNGNGTVFEVDALTHTLTTLASFNGANGFAPEAGLLADASGNLYGTTSNGGAYGQGGGTVFEVAAGTHAVTTLVSFNGTNGRTPVAGLIADASGNLYGTTTEGGANNDNGTVFEVDALTHTLTTLASFNGTNGRRPAAGLIADASGNLYGTTTVGGANDRGTVFEVANDANHTLSTLATFNGANGSLPEAGLLADASGNLYGTTYFGGANDRGTVFAVANDVYHTLTTLATFDGANGQGSQGDLIADASGNLFGTTSRGGASLFGGTVFEVAALTHTLSTLVRFNGTNGSIPPAGLLADASGNLYGTTDLGGVYGSGTVFMLSPVPEPSTLVLVAVGTFGLLISRRRKSRFAPRLNVVVALAACATFQQSHTFVSAATVRTVALSGQPAPGTASGVKYLGFEYPVLNDAGQTAFEVFLSGSGVDYSNDQSIWSEGSGGLALVARSGDHAPGTPSGVIFRANTDFPRIPDLNNAGQIAFAVTTSDSMDGVWSERSGSLALVARSGSQAPGTPSGVLYDSISTSLIVLNNAGQTAFVSSLTGGGGRGVWSEGSGSLALVARFGSQAPGTLSGVNFGVLPFGPPALNDAGQTAFSAYLTGSGVDSTNARGIWSERTGSLALVVRSGSQAPGSPSGVNYSSFYGVIINDAGQTAFGATLTGSGVDSTNNQGIWSEGSGSLALVARRGDHAPGTPSGVNYNGAFTAPKLNDAGKTAFYADLTGRGVDSTNNTGIWSEGSGSLALVARSGSQAPGTPDGVSYSNLFDVSFVTKSPVLNDAGQIAFRGSLTGSGVDSTNNAGIWATDRTGALQLIARKGDPLEVAPGDVRTVIDLRFAVGRSGAGALDNSRSSGFNNLGQLAFAVTFTDGSSGIFVSNRVASIPEPSTLLLLCFGSLAVLWRRHPAARDLRP